MIHVQPMPIPVANLTRDLASTLGEVARACARLRDPWWVIGSAALALVGLPGIAVPDVDVVTSRRDAEALIGQWNQSADPLPLVPSRQFRSEFRRFRHAALPIEVMGDFDVWTGADWYRVRPRTRVRVGCGGGEVYVAAADEQVEILRRIGRPKDLARAKVLEAHGRSAAAPAAPSLVSLAVAAVKAGTWSTEPRAVSANLLPLAAGDVACLLSV